MLQYIKNVFAGLNTPQTIQNISPDAMIVNGLMQSFASDYPDWTLEWRSCAGSSFTPSSSEQLSVFPTTIPKTDKWRDYGTTKYRQFKLVNSKKKITFVINYIFSSHRNGHNYADVMTHWSAVINGVEIDGNAGRQLADAYLALKKKHDDAKAVADKALARMKAEDAKWNIVEQVLDMKRTKSGRLIAKSSYCAVCDSPNPEKETEKLHNLSCPNRPAPKPRRPKVVKDPFVA